MKISDERATAIGTWISLQRVPSSDVQKIRDLLSDRSTLLAFVRRVAERPCENAHCEDCGEDVGPLENDSEDCGTCDPCEARKILEVER